MRFLIVGLGNPGTEYERTRHNIGFEVLDHLAQQHAVVFEPARYAHRASLKHKGRELILIKPQTYMNLSGKAMRYWLTEEKVPLERSLVISDDIALEYGRMRLRGKGGAGGHNGLQDIIDVLGTQVWARIRFGIGKEFHKGNQSNYVLGEWSPEEEEIRTTLMDKVGDGVKQFSTIGLSRTMNTFNN